MKNIFKNFSKKFANSKNCCTFAAYSSIETGEIQGACSDVLVSNRLQYNRHTVVPHLIVAAKPLFTGLKPKKGTAVFFSFKSFLSEPLRPVNKNATDAKQSNVQARVAHETRPTITLALTGVSNNPYLYAIRKSFFEFLQEEVKGQCCAELRFVKKYEAANLLFPGHRKLLHGKTVKI